MVKNRVKFIIVFKIEKKKENFCNYLAKHCLLRGLWGFSFLTQI